MTFSLHAWRFFFVAAESIHFPPGKSGNILRGAFGSIFRQIACLPGCSGPDACEIRTDCAYARIFEPSAAGAGPSGLSDWPRPFVFRASHLDGLTLAAGTRFHFDLHVFEMRHPVLAYFVLAFARVAEEGLGPRRGRARLESVWQLNTAGQSVVRVHDGKAFSNHSSASIVLLLLPDATPINRVTVRFETPTELKSGQVLVKRPDFHTLFARLRDRVSTLRALYGDGPLDLDFKGMGERASRVMMTECNLRQVDVERRSSRTGQVHTLGGFVGEASYEGELAEFIPFLRAARWTGIGRQTTWGKGHVEIVSLNQG